MNKTIFRLVNLENKEIINMNENKLLVFYINISNVDRESIEYFVKSVVEKIKPTSFDGEIIAIPIYYGDTRIDCINPKYITEVDLIKENTDMIEELNKNLKLQIELKKLNNE
jgi:allophanate hydrolase subunit 1